MEVYDCEQISRPFAIRLVGVNNFNWDATFKSQVFSFPLFFSLSPF